MTFDAWQLFLAWIIRRCERAKSWQRNWRVKNKEKQAQVKKQWAEKNRVKLRAAHKRWRDKNLVVERARVRNWAKSRGTRKYSSTARLARTCRKRVWDALRGVVKSARTFDLIGCSAEELKKHMEARFLPGMTWENYGQWHVDHVKACANFDLTKPEEQRTCFHYSNLQPLWALDNLRKGAK